MSELRSHDYASDAADSKDAQTNKNAIANFNDTIHTTENNRSASFSGYARSGDKPSGSSFNTFAWSGVESQPDQLGWEKDGLYPRISTDSVVRSKPPTSRFLANPNLYKDENRDQSTDDRSNNIPTNSTTSRGPTNFSSVSLSSLRHRSASPGLAVGSPSPSPTPSGSAFGHALSQHSPPSTAGSVGGTISNTSFKGFNGTRIGNAIAGSGSSSEHRTTSIATFGSTGLSRKTHSLIEGTAGGESSSGGDHSRQSSGYASSQDISGGAANVSNFGNVGPYISSGNSSNVNLIGNPFAQIGLSNKGRTESNSSGSSNVGGSSLMTFNNKPIGALASALARANLTSFDQQSHQMAPSSSHGSSAAQSSKSFNNLTLGGPSIGTAVKPPLIRQSFSDGVPLSAQQALLAGASSGQQQRSVSGAGMSGSVPVSLPTTGPLSASDPRTQLYVSNLPYRVRWQDLKDLFRRAGTVLRADVSLTADNRSRGFGTVLLATEDDARRACDMFKGFNWQGRTLDVKIDRSGTLLGVGIGHISQSNMMNNDPLSDSNLTALGEIGRGGIGVAPHSPLPNPGNAFLGEFGNGSPTPSPLGNHAIAPGSGAGVPSGHLNATPLMRAVPQRQQFGTSPLSAIAGNSSASGLSPALLPFLGGTSRASFAAPTSNSISVDGQQGISSNWSPQAMHNYAQPRSSSISAGMGGTAGYGAGSLGMQDNLLSATGQTIAFQSGQYPSFVPNNSNTRNLNQFGNPGIHQNVIGNPSMQLPQPPVNMMSNSNNSTYYGRVLFVGNLPFHCQWQDLKDLFRAAGNIQRADVALTPEGKSRGFGTVLFATPEDAQNAVRIYHGYEYSGRTLKVHFDRFAQMTTPLSGALPASPSQYTGAFAAANNPTPVSNVAAQQPTQQRINQTQHHQQQQQLFQLAQQNQPSLPASYLSQQRQRNPFSGQNGFDAFGMQNNASQLFGQQFQSAETNRNFVGQMQHDQSMHGIMSGNFTTGPFPNSFSVPMTQTSNTLNPTFNTSTLQNQLNDSTASRRNLPQTELEAKVIENPSTTSVQTETTGTENISHNEGKDEPNQNGDEIVEQASESTMQQQQQQQQHQAQPLQAAVGAGVRPGRITLPPQTFPAMGTDMQSYNPVHQRIPVPMTPGMPGFTFHPVPETPPVHHQFLSPGLGGPFSPPLASPTYLGPATPGAPAVRPYMPGNINPAPGAPIHFNTGASTPMASMMQTFHNQPNFNPMFPPIGMTYQAPPAMVSASQYGMSADLPQTPHWSQPRPPPPQQYQQKTSPQTSDQVSRSNQLRDYLKSSTKNGVVVEGKVEGQSTSLIGESGQIDDLNANTDPVDGQESVDPSRPSTAAEGYPFPLIQPPASVLLQRRASTNSPAAIASMNSVSNSTSYAEKPSPLSDKRTNSLRSMGNSNVGNDSVSHNRLNANSALLEIQASTGASTTEELARKIAQMSAQKALRLQQRDRVGSSSAALPSASSSKDLKENDSTMNRLSLPHSEGYTESKEEGRMGDDIQTTISTSALSGSALDDSTSSAGSIDIGQ